jgi:hypothetical protein
MFTGSRQPTQWDQNVPICGFFWGVWDQRSGFGPNEPLARSSDRSGAIDAGLGPTGPDALSVWSTSSGGPARTSPAGARPLAGAGRPECDLEQARVDLVEVDVGEVIEEATERNGTDASIGAW